MAGYRLELYRQIQPTEMEDKYVRLQNGPVRVSLSSVSMTFICATAIIGSLFALAARVPLSCLKQKVTMRQLSPFWLSGLALTILASEVNGSHIPIERLPDGKISRECIDEITDNRNDGLVRTAIISMLAILVGTIAYRVGLTFKKLS